MARGSALQTSIQFTLSTLVCVIFIFNSLFTKMIEFLWCVPTCTLKPSDQCLKWWARGEGLRLISAVERCTFYIYFLRSNGCDVEGLNTEVGAGNRGGGLSTLASPSLKPLHVTLMLLVNDDSLCLVRRRTAAVGRSRPAPPCSLRAPCTGRCRHARGRCRPTSATSRRSCTVTVTPTRPGCARDPWDRAPTPAARGTPVQHSDELLPVHVCQFLR